MRKQLIIAITLIFFSYILTSCKNEQPKLQDGAYVVSISSDGHYAIESTFLKKLILWDLQKHTKKLISKTANIYSAYFVKHRDAFMWQDATTNQVTIENVDGKILKQFNPGFPSYGQIISSNLKLYIASDINFMLHVFHNTHTLKVKLSDTGFYGMGKLLNMQFSHDGKYLLTCGGDDDMHFGNAIPGSELNRNHYPGDGLILWDLKDFSPLYGFPGNYSKSYASFNPLSNILISADETSNMQTWDLINGKSLFNYYNIFLGKFYDTGKEVTSKTWDKKVLKTFPPVDFQQPGTGRSAAYTLSLKFIDKTHFLRIIEDIPYVILYQVTNPAPQKYLKLQTNPYPSINDYTRDESIDSSWKAHILVTGHATDPGITVYQYNPKKQTLTPVWTAS